MKEGDFRPPGPYSSDTLQPTFMKLQTKQLLPGHDPACKISGGYIDVGGLGE